MTYKKIEEIFEFLTPKFKKKFDFVIKFFVRNSEKGILFKFIHQEENLEFGKPPGKIF